MEKITSPDKSVTLTLSELDATAARLRKIRTFILNTRPRCDYNANNYREQIAAQHTHDAQYDAVSAALHAVQALRWQARFTP